MATRKRARYPSNLTQKSIKYEKRNFGDIPGFPFDRVESDILTPGESFYRAATEFRCRNDAVLLVANGRTQRVVWPVGVRLLA